MLLKLEVQPLHNPVGCYQSESECGSAPKSSKLRRKHVTNAPSESLVMLLSKILAWKSDSPRVSFIIAFLFLCSLVYYAVALFALLVKSLE